MLRAGVIAALIATACGDNIPLPGAQELVIVAHEDDDLLFMQPDMFDAVHGHRSTTIVYVTAGDNRAGVEYASSRITASKAAYGWVAGSQHWICDWIELSHHAAQRCYLPDASLMLVFLGYPDGGVAGDYDNSLLRLWQGTIEHADTVADHIATYDRDGLIETVGEIIDLTRPTLIRTLEIAGTHGADHSDHMMVGALTVLAAARARTDAAILTYRGYNINFDPPNTPDALYDQVSLGMRAYEACQTGCAACADAVCDTIADPRYTAFLHRHYAIAMRPPPMTALLRSTNRCLSLATGHGVLDDCTRGTSLQFEPGGHVRVGDRCLRVLPDGELALAGCDAREDGFFLLDDEGHVWLGVAPAIGSGTATNHTMCLAHSDDHVRAEICGSDRDDQWELARPNVAQQRAQLGIAAHGRSIQLADLTGDGKADLCRIQYGGLWCAEGDGLGGFTFSRRIDSVAHPLSISPLSLMLGDIDGDGAIDACGRDQAGILCATASSGYSAERWTAAFAGSDAIDDDASLAIVGRQICGSSSAGATCAAAGQAATVRSTWPARHAALWPADFDADGAPDWCVANDAGPRCGLDADRSITADGAPWGFSLDTIVEGSTTTDGAIADRNRGATGDVSGDGRSDLCVIVGSRVECALSQGHAFGPRWTALELPAGASAEAMWLGDLDGDGKADPCVDDGTSITCSLSP
ncbi:MAG: Rhs family protein [Myxococcales bacterium]|nr:Rhs family protein [Myxococcales bacterium]